MAWLAATSGSTSNGSYRLLHMLLHGWCEGLAPNEVPTCGGVPKPGNRFRSFKRHCWDYRCSRAISNDLRDYYGRYTIALTLALALPLLPSVLGGGPSYLLVSEWRYAHDLALHDPYAKNLHGVMAFSAALILAACLASSPLGVVLPKLVGVNLRGSALSSAFGVGAACISSSVWLFTHGGESSSPPEP